MKLVRRTLPVTIVILTLILVGLLTMLALDQAIMQSAGQSRESMILTALKLLAEYSGASSAIIGLGTAISIFLIRTFHTGSLSKPLSNTASLPIVWRKTRESREVENRKRLLDHVREFWIKGVLDKAMINDVWLDLPAEERPQAVEPTVRRELRSAGSATIMLETGEKLIDVFRRSRRSLLILGAPGAGKTMALLELAKDLIAELDQPAELNAPRKPIPVVLNLASWTERHPEKLEDWVIERLHVEYTVPPKLSARWIDDGDLLFLLDGLDEIPAARRDACVAAISAFWSPRHDSKDNGIVVCSRIEEYKALKKPLRLSNAICLKPLKGQQVASYINDLGVQWEGLGKALFSDPVLRSLAESPLLLNIMAVAYRNVPCEQILESSNVEEKTCSIFDSYIVRCLRAESTHRHYANPRTRRYLSWLARQMIEHDQIIFSIEGLQPDWLSNHRQTQYRWLVRLIPALIVGLFFGLIGGLYILIGFTLVGAMHLGVPFALSFALGLGLVGAVFGGLVGGLGANGRIKPVDRLNWSWSHSRGVLGVALLGGLVGGLVGWRFFGLGFGIVLALIAVLSGELTASLHTELIELHVVPNLGIRRSLFNGWCVGLVCGLMGGLLAGLGEAFVDGPGMAVGNGLIGVLFAGLIGLQYGGRAFMRHATLRWLLWRSGSAPINYTEFLTYTSERHLTRQVGGGFVFRHRMLMDHFAEITEK